MDFLLDALTQWLKEMLVGGIMGNLSGMFDSVNQQVADIATQVGQTPQGWNGSIFSMIQNLSNSIMVPIAGVILAIVMTLELIQMITDRNNLHDVDTWMIFKWVFKSAAAILLVTNTWNIVMGVFDMTQSVVAQSAGIIGSDASIDISSVMTDMESRLMEMDLGPLLGLWVQSLAIGFTMWALYICIFIVIYGRIERQGNQNPLVHVYRYVTEGTFDAYLWQTVENKQKFISQIMTSKSPVRSCDDVDETALSFAEIKALCAGDPRIKERMDLDVEVSKLKLMKADHQSKQYRLEDQLLKYFPEEIEKHKGFIQGFEADLETLAAHPHPEDGFAGMEIRGDTLTDKENAGAALLDACKEVKNSEPVQIGSYRGFAMAVEFSAWKQEYTLLLKGQMTHRASLGTDPRGNLTRIDNALAQMSQRLEATKAQLDNLYQQQAAAKEEVGKPFPYEDDLRVKSARLVELDTLLNLDGRGRSQPESVIAKSARPSVLDSLKRPVPPRSPEKKPKQHEDCLLYTSRCV